MPFSSDSYVKNHVPPCCPTRSPRAACVPPAEFKWPIRVSLNLYKFVFKKTWLTLGNFKANLVPTTH